MHSTDKGLDRYTTLMLLDTCVVSNEWIHTAADQSILFLTDSKYLNLAIISKHALLLSHV